ncbi:hypothetical protein [uncultured Anaerococcus sp.]|uniref:hypothetical protein n=1 Tax=uncultured Anaerococcus sp. TaxID=293428 RepID=UPI0025FC5561|nr:hypothetical protein [uncultured Anaerococcus sp.]
MKKIIPIMALSLALVGCANQDAPKSDVNNKESQVSEKTDDTQVIEVGKAEDNKENSEADGSADTSDKKKQPEESSDDDKKEQAETEEKESADDSKEEKSKEEDQSEDQDSSQEVSKDDLFYNPFGPFSSVNENGELVDQNGNAIADTDVEYYTYVKYTNNVFVKSKKDIYDQVSIVRMNDKNVETLFEFPGVDDFRPLGMIGNRIYGFHDQQSKAEINGTPTLDKEKSAIGYVDLDTGEVHDFKATAEDITGDAVVIDGELQFTKPGDNEDQNAYNFDLYKLDLSKGDDQEAELLEKNFNLQYLFGQKRFENGKPVWKIYRADNDNFYVNDQKFPFLWSEEGSQEIIGNNIFYYETQKIDDKLSKPLKVINMSSGETVLDTQIRGMKISGNKLYYLNTENELESVDIEL